MANTHLILGSEFLCYTYPLFCNFRNPKSYKISVTLHKIGYFTVWCFFLGISNHTMIPVPDVFSIRRKNLIAKKIVQKNSVFFYLRVSPETKIRIFRSKTLKKVPWPTIAHQDVVSRFSNYARPRTGVKSSAKGHLEIKKSN